VLRASVDTSKREAWYARQIKEGVQVVISHPKLVETGLDLLDFPTIISYSESSILQLRCSRAWRPPLPTAAGALFRILPSLEAP
jgi:hypothetical protein